MAENIISLMFPEYKDKSNPVTSEDWTTDDLYDDKTLGEQIKEVAAMVDFFSDEDCQIEFDSKNVTAYLYPTYSLPEIYPSRERQMRFALKGTEDWRRYRVSSETEEYNIYHNIVKDETRTEIASRLKSLATDSFIIATNIPGMLNKNWELKQDGGSFAVESVSMHIPDVFDWLSKHHKPLREYEWNKKHGENGKGADPGNKGDEVSVLLCSIDHAKELLPKAIGEPMYDFLYCFDAEHNKYMEFPAGCKHRNLQADAKTRKYHSYHIDDERQIPKRVLAKISILKDQSKQI